MTTTHPAAPVDDRVDPRAVLEVIQHRILDATRRVVLVEPSSSMFWALSTLRARRPGAIRVFPGYGSIGQANGGGIGVSLATGEPAVVLSGDLSMLAIDALSSGVAASCPFLTIVLQDERQALPFHGCAAARCYAAQATTELPRTDFAGYARALGGDGLRVTRAEQLDSAVRGGLAADRPFVVDVLTSRVVIAPIGDRIADVVDRGASIRHELKAA
jgi:acetolactate synthase-1/2/3 large subunit